MTIFTAEDSLDNLGRIYAMNGMTKLDIWDGEECNEIRGTDGSQFPVSLMDKTKDLKIFIKSFCRTLKLSYDREVTVLQKGIPAWRYRTPEGEFASSLKNPENKCYCDADDDTKECPPDGVFDASKCLDGIPLLLSYPHFMEGDSSLFEHFEGLRPNRHLHETFADIHPRMAFPIGGSSRLQMNFKVTSKEFSQFFSTYSWYTKLPKDLVLPIFWFEVTSGEIPAEFQTIVFHTTQSANATYLTIQYGSLIGAIVSLLLIISTSYYYIVQLTNKKKENIIVTYSPNIYPELSATKPQKNNEWSRNESETRNPATVSSWSTFVSVHSLKPKLPLIHVSRCRKFVVVRRTLLNVTKVNGKTVDRETFVRRILLSGSQADDPKAVYSKLDLWKVLIVLMSNN